VTKIKDEEIGGHTSRMGKVISACKTIIGKPKGKRTICKYEDKCKRNMKEIHST
jgi:hypothetical protein